MTNTPDWRRALGKRWRSAEAGPFFDLQDPPARLRAVFPEDYLQAIDEFGGREGFLGATYLRLYRFQELLALNFAYQVPDLFPEVMLFASNGHGDAFAFPLGQSSVIQVPLIPLCADNAQYRAMGFTEFLFTLADSAQSPRPNPDALGMEVHCKQPLCVGGSPTDPENREYVPVAQHPDLCRYWNRVYRDASDRR